MLHFRARSRTATLALLSNFLKHAPRFSSNFLRLGTVICIAADESKKLAQRGNASAHSACSNGALMESGTPRGSSSVKPPSLCLPFSLVHCPLLRAESAKVLLSCTSKLAQRLHPHQVEAECWAAELLKLHLLHSKACADKTWQESVRKAPQAQAARAAAGQGQGSKWVLPQPSTQKCIRVMVQSCMMMLGRGGKKGAKCTSIKASPGGGACKAGEGSSWVAQQHCPLACSPCLSLRQKQLTCTLSMQSHWQGQKWVCVPFF